MAAKGYDDTPPRNGTILFYTVVTLIFLLLVKVTLDSYFASVMGEEVRDKILTRGMEPVKEMRAREAKQLEAGSMPMERATQMLSQLGRAGIQIIEPKSGMGDDGYGMEEVRGWTKLDRKVRPIMRPMEAAPVDADGGIAPAEAGAIEPAKPADLEPAAPAARGVVH